MNVLDKVIGVFSPKAAFERGRYRMGMQQLQEIRAYEGAKKGRRTAGWHVTGASANSEINPALPTLRNRSRDLKRNNPYARRGIHVLVRSMVGSGVKPKFEDKAHGQIFKEWSKQCDADGLNDLDGLISLAEEARRTDGEVLIRFRPRRLSDDMVVPLKLQLLEADFLDSSKNESYANGSYVIAGVQFNAIGEREGYWLFREHPGETSIAFRRMSLESYFVPASEVIHYFKRERPSQVRGVPDLAVALMRLRDLDDYEDAELVRKKLESCFSVFITQPQGTSSPLGAPDPGTGRKVDKVGPGLVTRLNTGEGVEFAQPSQNNGYGEYIKIILRAVAAALGITYEDLTGDLNAVNYSSLKAGRNQFNRMIDADQWLTMVPGLLAPIMNRWVAMAAIAGLKVRPAVDWTMPKRDSADPLKDVLAEKEEIRGAMRSLSESIRSRGHDPEEVWAEMAKDDERLKQLKLISDSNAAVTEGLLDYALKS
ncbi:MAG: phage portal protein [Polynucleobacter sp.]|nr:phage portal protein [Polynucleobacter sp.]